MIIPKWMKNYSCDGQISIFDYMHESIPNFDTMSIKDAADRIGKKLGLEFKESYRYGDENENAVEYTAKNKKLKIDIYFSHYVDTVNDGRRFLSVDIQNTRHEGFSSPCESIEEALEMIRKKIKDNKLRDEQPTNQTSICEYSQHECNRTELWKIADSLDDIECPHKCCRACDVKCCGARCNGSEEPQRDRKQELDEKYAIPREHQKEEGWTDDWHYTELETPTETGIYYCIKDNTDYYNYTYMAWAYGHWWAYAGYGTKWLIIWEGSKRDEWLKPFAWVTVPDLYYRTDKHYQFLLENFVTKEDWKYEQKLEQYRKERLNN